MRRIAVLSLAALAACTRSVTTPAPARGGATTAEITADDLRHRLFLIAHDSMMGRETGSEGNWKTAEYVASEFKRLGLEPAGENGTFFQTVPFYRIGIDPTSSLMAGDARLAVNHDFIPFSAAAPTLNLKSATVVYAGSLGDTTKMISSEDGAGKVVVIDFPPNTPGALLTWVNRRYANALSRARVQLDLIPPDQIARLREGRPVLDTTRNTQAPQALMFSRAGAARVFGTDVAALAPGTVGKPLTGRVDFRRTPVQFAARNVVAILRGSDPTENRQYVSLTAHNDHVGFNHSPLDHDSVRAFLRVVRPQGADSPNRPATPDENVRIRAILDSLRKHNPPRLDSIYNGADDDGSGTVSILEIAEKLANGPRPRRSILFVSHTAEEVGLVGSRWFTDHATVPIDSIVGEMDMDMIGRALPTDLPGGFDKPAADDQYIEIVGSRRLSREFGDTLESVNARQPAPFKFNYEYDAPGHPENFYCRADHYSYARYGIPSISIARGLHLDYHQITDEPQYINYPGLERASRMIYATALVVANQASRPQLSVPKPVLGSRCVQ